MAITLIKKNYVKYITLYIKNFIRSIGGYEHCLLVLLTASFSLYGALVYRDKLLLFIFIITLFTIWNNALIVLVHIGIRRYTMYTDFVQLIAFNILILQKFM